MPQSAAPYPQADADQLEGAVDEAIAACGGDARAALKALIVANEYLESEVCELMQAVSRAYVRGRFKPQRLISVGVGKGAKVIHSAPTNSGRKVD